MGILCVGVFVFGTSFVVWYALKLIMGLRVSEEEEFSGMDMPEFGLAAYPEFVQQTGYDYGSGRTVKKHKNCSVWETSHPVLNHILKGVLSSGTPHFPSLLPNQSPFS